MYCSILIFFFFFSFIILFNVQQIEGNLRRRRSAYNLYRPPPPTDQSPPEATLVRRIHLVFSTPVAYYRYGSSKIEEGCNPCGSIFPVYESTGGTTSSYGGRHGHQASGYSRPSKPLPGTYLRPEYTESPPTLPPASFDREVQVPTPLPSSDTSTIYAEKGDGSDEPIQVAPSASEWEEGNGGPASDIPSSSDNHRGYPSQNRYVSGPSPPRQPETYNSIPPGQEHQLSTESAQQQGSSSSYGVVPPPSSGQSGYFQPNVNIPEGSSQQLEQPRRSSYARPVLPPTSDQISSNPARDDFPIQDEPSQATPITLVKPRGMPSIKVE